MQDAYVGDIGDFGKLVLLKLLSKDRRVGVNWYFVSEETKPSCSSSNDGKHRNYLEQNDPHLVKSVDPELFDSFLSLGFRNSGHSIRSLETLLRLSYYSPCCRFSSSPVRARWAAEGVHHLRDAELVFFDPDNGLHRRPSEKHVTYDELAAYWKNKQSLLIYHHLARIHHESQIADLQAELIHEFPGSKVSHLRFRRGTARVYFLVTQPDHDDLQISFATAQKNLGALMTPLREWRKQQRSE